MANSQQVLSFLAAMEKRINERSRCAYPATEPPLWACEFENYFGDFTEQAKVPGRATLIDRGRFGGKCVRLHTEPGDNNVNGSGSGERNDLRLGNAESDATEGREWWFAHSVLFPDDFVDQPESNGTWYWGSVFNWHDDADDGKSQGPVQLMMMPRTAIAPDRQTGLWFEIYGGDPASPVVRKYPIAEIARNIYYDFVYHIRWSSTRGYLDGWLNGQRVISDQGPNLYTGHGAYLKLANYHEAHGKASSIIHDRIVRGKTWQSVSLTNLEGVQ